MERILLMVVFVLVIGAVWWMAMRSAPGKGLHRAIEKTVHGLLLCLVCYLVLSPFGFQLPQTPLSALLAGYLGIPGIALSAFLSVWP